ncbi:hypothetical protein BDV95DRAFT_244884 [Massariosphaeria phaeospora]|uniref:Uncharacterized protein n=1 Tax=Massariosphaeria phaeospora TaxID=100035 RepID=A0A7C8HZ92_9PLEO|nr:hypothetical protein BDV95DRAFT_244884 [Massariosphaeria phaeospora]
MTETLPLNRDPYALAYRYHEYMQENPPAKRETNNPYYENLLANQPDPSEDATDAKSRAIRYAKKHYESFYELRDVDLIVQLLDRGQLTEAE